MDNPVVLILLIALACAAVITGALLGANFYRRREATADAKREADRAAAYVPERTEPTPARQAVRSAHAAPSRYDARPVQQTAVHDNSGVDLVNLLVMQQMLNSVGNDHHHEDRSEEHRESPAEAQEYVQEPVGYEAPAAESAPEPVYSAPEPASYTAPEPVYTAPEPSYSPPSYDSSPSYDSGSFSGGDSGSF